MKHGNTTPLPIQPDVAFKRKKSQDLTFYHLAGLVSMLTHGG